EDPWCPRGGGWKVRLDRGALVAAVARASGAKATPAGRAEIRLVGSGDADGALVSRIELRSETSVVSASFESVARAVRVSVGRWAIHSRRFRLVDEGQSVTLAGSGRGHLAGMCQAGAAEMAKKGKGWREILEFYYPGAAVEPGRSEGR
ncbi:MAG: hypothetical protein HY303_02390, partial [Candidatus Wallbacteria bacterium]|nr:hypothetical protein [Candidatus Wallbacteria bacterium]